MGPELVKILKEMCSRVNADYKSINFKEDAWYTKHTWNSKEESEFKAWLVDYLYNNKDARNEIMSFPSRNKKLIKGAVKWFNFNYGWKTVNK